MIIFAWLTGIKPLSVSVIMHTADHLVSCQCISYCNSKSNCDIKRGHPQVSFHVFQPRVLVFSYILPPFSTKCSPGKLSLDRARTENHLAMPRILEDSFGSIVHQVYKSENKVRRPLVRLMVAYWLNRLPSEGGYIQSRRGCARHGIRSHRKLELSPNGAADALS